MIANGRLRDEATIQRRFAHLEERHRPMWRFLKYCTHRDGAYLSRAHLPGGCDDSALF
ncbi:MAG: hypothetical protein ACO3RV_08075 [Luteolibacter sp.]